ncbi:hypothetical protein WJX79_001301 [Trebouxia sp. C0005]
MIRRICSGRRLADSDRSTTWSFDIPLKRVTHSGTTAVGVYQEKQEYGCVIDQQGMPSTSYAADMLGSQANETVLIEQPQAYVTQKARVKRNRRTEWDYYVQFPGFPEDEGNWYSARAIKTQHPRGAELIREFEHPDDAADVTPPSSAPKSQPTQQAVPFTQDAGPSQIGSLPMHVSGHAYASTSKMQPAMHAGMLGQASDQSQGPAAQTQQPGLSSAQQTNWGLGLQPQWPARPPHPALGGASAQSQLAAKHMAHQMPTQQLPNQMPLQYQQHPGEEHQRIEPAAFQAASPTLTDDSGLGMDIVDQVEQSKARKYMSASKWPTASIAGARRVGESLELHVKWTDGYDTWISLEALKRRQHCKSAIIDYLVSKVRKKTKG